VKQLNYILLLLFITFLTACNSKEEQKKTTNSCLQEYERYSEIISNYQVEISDIVKHQGCEVIPIYASILKTKKLDKNPNMMKQLVTLFTVNKYFSTLVFDNSMIREMILNNILNDKFIENFTYLEKKKLHKKEIKEIKEDIDYLNYTLLASLYAQNKKESLELYSKIKSSISIELMPSFILILSSVEDKYTFEELLKNFTFLAKKLSTDELKTLTQYPQYFIYFLYPKQESLAIETISSSQLKKIQQAFQKRVIYVYHEMFEKYRYTKGISQIDYALLTVHNIYPYLLKSYQVNENGFKKLFHRLVYKGYILSLFKEDKCSQSSKENFAVFGKGNIESGVKLLREEKELVSTLFSEFKSQEYSIMSFFYVANLYAELDTKGWNIFKELLETLPYEYDNKIVFIQRIERAGYFRNIVTIKDYKSHIDASYGDSNPKYKYVLLTPYPSQTNRTLFETVLNTNISDESLQRSLVDLIGKDKNELEKHEFTRSEKFFGNIDRLDTTLTVASVALAPFTGGASLAYVASNFGNFTSKKIISQILKKVTNQKIHLKFDTGMHRNGLKIEKIDTTDLNIVGIMTHFRSADELSCEQFCQQKQWQKVKEIYKDKDVLYHSGNSATVLRAENYEDDFARCGISIYGYEEMHGSFGEFDLKPVMSLYGEKISTRELKKGDRVGYGGVGVVLHDSMVSTYDIGYGDGFFRHDGKSELLLDGKKVVGRISMDSISLLGDDDKVCLIGDAKMIARKFNTISYDVLVKLNSSISREVV